MSLPYSRSYFPPIPMLSVRFSRSGQLRWLGPYAAIIDSGADATIMPAKFVRPLRLKSLDNARIRSPWGEYHSVLTYVVDIEVQGYSLPGVIVAADPTLEQEIILGRTVLNKLPILLDGPGQYAEVLDDRFIKRLRDRRRSRDDGT